MKETILEVKHLKQYFPIRKNYIVKAVDDVSFELKKGEVFGLVGETGCGKSTIARSIMGVYPISGGGISLNGTMQMIFQDSAAALDPHMTVKQLIGEPLLIKKRYDEKKILNLMQQVGLDESYKDKYPSEISGGQRQRVAIARAISIEPDLIIADEPIASLDVSIQAQIINLFIDLQKEKGFTFLFIAHDLSIIRFISDKVAVMRKGKIVEIATTEELFSNPIHPYTRSLLDAMPIPDPIYGRQKKVFEYDEKEYVETDKILEVVKGHWVREVKKYND